MAIELLKNPDARNDPPRPLLEHLLALRDMIVFAAVSWVLFSWLFSLYVAVSGKFGAYGYLGTVLVAMVLMFYCLFFLFIGGYINAQIGACRRMETNPQF